MKCPLCKENLRVTDLGEYGFVIIDICPKCQGAWFDKGELDRLDGSVWTNVEELDYKVVEPDHKDMKCPKCQLDMLAISPLDAKELIIDRCSNCQGFWLDKGELSKMNKLALELDSKTAKNMTIVKRPEGWSKFRWSFFCFKKYYFDKK